MCAHKETVQTDNEDSGTLTLEKESVAQLFLDPHVERTKQGKWTKLLALAGIASTIGTTVPGNAITKMKVVFLVSFIFIAGYAIGVVNSPAVYIKNWCNESLIRRYDLHLSSEGIEILWSTVVSMFLVGGAIGSLSGAWTGDRFGRKTSLIASEILLLTAGVCFLNCRLLDSVELLLLGRFLSGFASGVGISCLPMYLSEIAPLALRGTLGVFCPVGLTAGVVVGQVFSLSTIFGSEAKWHLALSFYVVIILISLIPYKYFPESPKWLYVIKEDTEAAQLELQRLRCADEQNLITRELEYMALEARETQQTIGFLEVFKQSKFLLPLILVSTYQAGQQLSGINAIFYYSVSIFQRAGLSEKAAEWANLGAGSFNLAISLCGPYLMAKFNRRPLMLFSSFCCCLSLFSFALFLHFIDLVSWFPLGCMICIFLYIFFFQFGVGPIPFFIGSELFEVAPRPVGMSVGTLASFSGNFIVGMTFPSLQNAWGAMVFLPFALTCAVMFLLTFFYLPETRNRNPTDVALIISKGFRSEVRK